MKKLFLLIFMLGAVTAVGILALNGQRFTMPEPTQPQTPGETPAGEQAGDFAVTEAMATSIIRNALDDRFDEKTATYTVANLDGHNGPELIIGAAGSNIATILVVSVSEPTGAYEHMGATTYQEFLRDVPEVRDLQDITGDGRDELFISLGYGGASSDVHGFLQADPQEKKLAWIQLRDPNNQMRDAIFLMGGSVTHTETVQVLDINGDGKKEIAELFSQIGKPYDQENSSPSKQAGELWCIARVYQWNGSSFDFNRALSEQFLESLGPSCAI